MNQRIDAIIADLARIDPAFKGREAELRTIIMELIEAQPDTKFDAENARRIRERLLNKPSAPKRSPYFPFMQIISNRFVPALALIAVFIGTSAYLVSRDSSSQFAFQQQFTTAGKTAFGTIQPALKGMGGDGNFTPSAMPLATEASPRQMATDSAAGKMMIFPAEYSIYEYTYEGDPLELTESEGTVYKRNRGQTQSVTRDLARMNLGLANLGSFDNLRIRNFDLVENKPYGYSVNVNLDEGMISINPDYLTWPGMVDGPGNSAPLTRNDIPDDASLIALADAFIKDHGINRSLYANPVVQKDGGMRILATDDVSTSMYVPDTITINYPLKIKDTLVYEEGGYPHGLQVSVNVREKKVASVFGLSSQSYESSSYALETDEEKILSILSRGGVNAYIPEEDPNIKVKKISVSVGTPQRILLHVMSYDNKAPQELFVPALLFPVTKPPTNEQYYPTSIAIPLAQDLLNNKGPQPPVIMYDANVR